MHPLVYEGRTYNCREGESVLEAFLRQGVSISFSCRSGICQVCLQRCTRGRIPERAQAGLRPTLKTLGYFLPCRCVPDGPMEITPPRESDLYSPAVVREKTLLAPDVCRLLLESATSLYYHPGQFINLRRADGLTRSYSLASVPQEDDYLELHVKRMPGGEMSNWIFDTLAVDDELEIQGPQGACYYVPNDKACSLLLVGTGTGLAPLIGITRDALYHGHRGMIRLYHGSHRAEGLYLHERLQELARTCVNFEYTGCVSGPQVPEGFTAGRAHEVALSQHRDLAGACIYLAGLPAMVEEAEAKAREAGAARIYTDPFAYKDRRRTPRPTSGPELAVDPEMWAALGQGELLQEILKDFYDRVFEDPQLAPYFHGVTKRRLIEKVYSFLRQAFTGERVYFGDRPRNAHHWMVISDALFDHREALLASCIRRHGLPEHLVRRWMAFEERFRRDIVKSEPWKRIVDGVEMPLEGFAETELGVGTLCDGCGAEIPAGTRVRYHVRLGTTYCGPCTERGVGRAAEPPSR